MTTKGQICFFAACFLTFTGLFLGIGYNARSLRPDVKDYIEHVHGKPQYVITHTHN